MAQLDVCCRNRGETVTEVSYNKYRLETKEQSRLGAHVHRFRDLSRKGKYEVGYTVTAADQWHSACNKLPGHVVNRYQYLSM